MPKRIFTMDGSWHYFGDPKCCREGECPCGGRIHSQSGYGFLAWECDGCGSDAHPHHAKERLPHEPPDEFHPPPCWRCGGVEEYHRCPVSALEPKPSTSLPRGTVGR